MALRVIVVTLKGQQEVNDQAVLCYLETKSVKNKMRESRGSTWG